MAQNKDWCLVLLDAARIVDGRDIDADHGYASTLPVRTPSRGRRSKNSKIHTARNLHNELEKTRRASLRRHLERLKELVPLAFNSGKHTTLGLLNKSKSYIKSLEFELDRRLTKRDCLLQEHASLLQRWSQLTGDQYRERDETSPVTTSSLSSELGDVDVTGASDGDDLNSNLSSASGSSPLPFAVPSASLSSSLSSTDDTWSFSVGRFES